MLANSLIKINSSVPPVHLESSNSTKARSHRISKEKIHMLIVVISHANIFIDINIYNGTNHISHLVLDS